MKKLLLTLFYLLALLPTYADTKPIDWDPKNESEGGPRTIVPHFVASHDDDVLYLTADMTLWGVEIEVTDNTGSTVFMQTTSTVAGVGQSFIMGLGTGVYTVRVAIGDCEYTGCFSII